MPRALNRTGIPRRGSSLLVPVLLLAACGRSGQPIEIPFAAQYGDAPVRCDLAAGDLRLTDLRLFVHDLRLLTPGGREVPVELPDRSPWQGGAVALLDLEDGTGACRNGTAAMNASVQGIVPPGEYRGLAFRIGVPASRNHADPLRAPPPLNQSAMHWHWLTGYKFLRAGIAGEDDGFWIHLGSTLCDGTAATPKGCAHANLPQIVLTDFRPGTDIIIFDLAPLAATADLTDATPSDCSSGPTEPACAAPFRALGLDFASGEATGTPAVVRVTRRE
jgi:uncharacterized repeat protein (TIGR04052 family)